ncbi:hypothetical protein Lal_00017205 [Lupinus albus]|nr:hypothetical protein Lal_00017205 [Lupinus albus]
MDKEVVKYFKSSYGNELLQILYHNLESHAALIYIRVDKFYPTNLESCNIQNWKALQSEQEMTCITL